MELSKPFVHLHDFPYDDEAIKKRFTEDTASYLVAFKEAIKDHKDTYKCRKCTELLTEDETDDWLCVKCIYPAFLARTTLTEETGERILREVAAKLNIQASALIHPLRLATTGMAHGISLFAVLEILGKNTVIERIDKILEKSSCIGL